MAPLRGYVKSSPVASYVYIAARKRGRLTQSLHWGATWRTDVNRWTYAVATLDLEEYNRREPIRSTGVTTFLIFSCTWTNPDHYLIHSSIFFFQFFFCEMQREPKALTVISWSCLHSQLNWPVYKYTLNISVCKHLLSSRYLNARFLSGLGSWRWN